MEDILIMFGYLALVIFPMLVGWAVLLAMFYAWIFNAID